MLLGGFQLEKYDFDLHKLFFLEKIIKIPQISKKTIPN
jgi:hypothetical protein